MEKSAEAFRTISEVADLLDTPAHVLRFWESRFSQVKPVKRAGGRRYYRPADLALLGGIKKLLKDDGLTIRGVQKILKEHGVRYVASLSTVDLGGEVTAQAESAPTIAPSTEPAATVASAQKPEARTWPPSPDPDTAAEGDDLLPDPDDKTEAAPSPVTSPFSRAAVSPGAERRAELGSQRRAPEAPMQVDVPTLPRGEADNVRLLGEPQVARTEPVAAAAATAHDSNPPAAAMLRAMDALRARDKKSELMSVYLRLVDLRERLAQHDRSAQK